MAITIMNKHHGAKGIYIGRGSPLGNPFKLKSAGGTFNREESIAKYEEYLRTEIWRGNKPILMALEHIRQEHRRGEVALVCFCAPLACHGDVIKSIVEDM